MCGGYEIYENALDEDLRRKTEEKLNRIARKMEEDRLWIARKRLSADIQQKVITPLAGTIPSE